MTKEQLEQLIAIRERVMQNFVEESDPVNWPSIDSQQGRGDRLYMKKNAIAASELLVRLDKRIAQAKSEGDQDKGISIAEEAALLEKEALRILEEQNRRRGPKVPAPIIGPVHTEPCEPRSLKH